MLIRWEPFGSIRRRGNLFSELTDIQQEMNHIFEEFFGKRRAEMAEGAWLPAVDVSESDSEMVVQAELPGMTQDDIELNLQDNVLTLQGKKKKKESKEEKENHHRVECSYGSFNRSFSLPCNVKTDDVKATFKDGVLEIILPKTEEAKPQKIDIKAGS